MWDSHANAEVYAEQGHALLARLKAELPDKTVELDLWPLDQEWLPKG